MKIINTLLPALCLTFCIPAIRGFSSPDTNGAETGIACPALVPGCGVPTGFSVVSATQNALTVRWDAGDAATAGFELVRFKKSDVSKNPSQAQPVFIASGNSYAFLGLTHNTAYYLYIRRVCAAPPGGTQQYSDWIRIGGRTTAVLLSDCHSDTTAIGVSNIGHRSFELVLSPQRYLSPTGRRLLVRYRLDSVPPDCIPPAALGQWQQRLIYDAADLKIDNLFRGGTYTLYCTQLRDGSYLDYTKACPEVGPFVVTLASHQNDCNYAADVSVSCTGADFITLRFDGPALGYDSLRYLVAVKPQLAGADAWKFYYHFHGAETTIGDLDEQTSYQINAYLLIGKSGFSYDYICSERYLGEHTTLLRNNVADADGDGIPDACDNDDNDGPTGDLDGDGIQNQFDDESTENPYPQMPSLSCDIPAPNQPFDPNELLPSASPGDIFFINGFPILLEQVSGGLGLFSGSGVIGLPFQTKYLKVEFHNVQVAKTKVIFEGNVRGVPEDLNNYPNLPLDTITFGLERFCQAVPEEEGFGEGGIWSLIKIILIWEPTNQLYKSRS